MKKFWESGDESAESDADRARAENQMLLARDKAAKATMKANEILSKTSSTNARSDFEAMERRMQMRERNRMAGMPRLEWHSSNEESVSNEELTKLATQVGFGLVWLVFNTSFLFLLLYFVHIPFELALVAIPTTYFFLCRIWFRGKQMVLPITRRNTLTGYVKGSA